MKDIKKFYALIKRYLMSHKTRFISYFLIVIVLNLCAIIEPYIVGNFIDGLIAKNSYTYIINYCIVYVLVILLNIVFSYIVEISGAMLNFDLCMDFKMDVLKHVQDVSLTLTNNYDKSDYSYRVNNDVSLLIMYFLNFLINILDIVIYFVFPIVYLFKINKVLAIICILLFPLVYVLYKYFKDKIFKATYEVQNALSNFFSKLEEQIFNLKFIKINSIQPLLRQKFFNSVKTYKATKLKNVKLTFMYNTINRNMDTILKISLFIYGGISIMKGKMTVGSYIIVASYITLITKSYSEILNLGKNIQECNVCYDRLKEILDVKEETNGELTLQDINEIKIENLQFKYGEKVILDNFNYSFEKGKIYSVFGKNGSGKSTLICLLLGLYINEYEGKILYNNTVIQDIDMIDTRRNLVSISEQEPTLLEDTIKHNILFGNESCDEEKLNNYIKILSLDKYIDTLPDGLSTEVKVSPDNLSGGQKQKISLVKSLYKEPKLLILDEPTSALDASSKTILINYLSESKEDRITIIITHDKDFMDISDDCIEIKNLSEETAEN